MKNIAKFILVLHILYFSTQSITLDIDNIGKDIIKTIIDIYKEKNITEENYNQNYEDHQIIGPFEIEFIKEMFANFINCKTCFNYFYFNQEITLTSLALNIPEILNITKSLIIREDFDKMINRFLNKINIFNFETWIKISRHFIERAIDLPKVNLKKDQYIIYYSDGSSEAISKNNIDKCYYKSQRKAIKAQEFLDKLENLLFYCYKFYSLTTYNSFDDYAERFAGSTISNLFNGLSPISFLFKNLIDDSFDDVYIKNFCLDSGNSLSKYLYRKLGFKLFLNIIKSFLGPIGFTIDLITFSYNI